MNINTNQFNINFKSELNVKSHKITCGEFFAGGGGWTEGMHNIPNAKTKWILNHDKTAIKTNLFHHKDVKVYWSDIYVQDEKELEYVDYAHASIECTQHSNANGGLDKKIGSYMMGWELYRYLKFLKPLVISIENVPEFKKWAPVDENGIPIKEREGEEFEKWKKSIMDLGYEYKESIRNAADDGLPTRRVRYFAFFYKPGIDISFPEHTHSKSGKNGLKWLPCRPYIDLTDEGTSIFGREFNENIPKHLRRKLVSNSLRRIGGGIKKYCPEAVNFITHFYGGENQNRFQSIEDPINTISTNNRHQLVTTEKLQFIMDYCRTDNYQTVDEPLRTQLTWQTKTFVNIDNFLCQFYGGSDQTQSVDMPVNTISTNDRHQLIRVEKFQFITKYLSSNGKPEANVESLDDPISPIMTEFKHQLITILDNFDVKARFLRQDELAACSTFPRDYFSRPGLKLSHKNAVRMIGNAVPPMWAKILTESVIPKIIEFKKSNKIN